MIKKEYEIISHDALDKLKEELDELRDKRKEDIAQDPKAYSGSMDKLNRNLERFSELFEHAAAEMSKEEQEQQFIMHRLEPMNEALQNKLNQVLTQNQQIAQGIVSLADMLNRELPKLKNAFIQLQQQQNDMPISRPLPEVPRMPPPMPPPPMPEMPESDLPPMSESKKKKFGLF